MIRPSRMRRLIAAAVLLLLLPLAQVQAAPVMHVESLNGPGAPGAPAVPIRPQPVPPAPADTSQLPADAGANPDPDLARRIDEHRAQLAAQRAALQAETTRPRIQLDTPAGPRPAQGSSAASLSTYTSLPTYTSSSPYITSPGITTAGYTLSVNRDLFQPDQTAVLTFTLIGPTGAPVPDARLHVGAPTAPAVTTDAAGQAAATYTAPGSNRVDPVYVSLPGSTTPEVMAELYTTDANHGVLVVEHVTDRAGAPVTSFHLRALGGMGEWSGDTTRGSIGLILRKGTTFLTTFIPQAEPIVLYQSAAIAAYAKTVLHPSASNAVKLTVVGAVDGTFEPGDIYLHRSDMVYDGDSPLPLPPTVWVTPGDYSIVWASQSPEPVLLYQPQASLSAPANAVSLIGARRDLGRVRFAGTDGYGNPYTFAHVDVRLGRTAVGLKAASALIPPGDSFAVQRYDDRSANGNAVWMVQFTPVYASYRISYPGEEMTVPLGGPLVYDPPMSQNAPGGEIPAQTYLTNDNGDRFTAYQLEPDGRRTPARGTLSLADNLGRIRTSRTVWSDQRETKFILPLDATDTYGLVADWPDLGPYAPAFTGQSGGWISERPRYAMTLSQTMLQPNTQVTVTATLTEDGAPAAGVAVETSPYGWRTTTDAAGRATFTFTTGQRGVVQFRAASSWGGLLVGEAYVVPDGYGVVRIRQATDHDGQAQPDYRAYMYWADPADGSYDREERWSDSSSGTLSFVRPAGTNHIEADLWKTPAFLYRTVEVTAGATTEVDLSGTNTVELVISAALDGAPLHGYPVLHNEAVPVGGRWEAMASRLWVTPGTYAVQFRGQAPNRDLPVLTRPHVSLAEGGAPTMVVFSDQSPGLASFTPDVRDGYGNLTGHGVILQTAGINLQASPDTRYLLTPGLAYAPANYTIYAGSTNLDFDTATANAGTVAVPGQPLALTLGGPLEAVLQPRSPGAYKPGQMASFIARVQSAAAHHRVAARINGVEQYGWATLYDAANASVWSGLIEAARDTLNVPMPEEPGNYRLEAVWNVLGTYSDPVSTSLDLTVADTPLEVTVTPNAVPVGQPTLVTVEVRQNGAPVPNSYVSAGWLYSGYTDADGRATFEVNRPYSTAAPVEASAGTATGLAHLFVLQPHEAGIEIDGTNAAGERLQEFYTSVEVVTPTSISFQSNYLSQSAGFVMPAGQTLVQLIAEEPLTTYVLNRSLTTAPGQVVHVTLDGAAAPPVAFRPAAANEVDIDHVLLRPTASHFSSVNMGAWFDPAAGAAHARVTPGEYDLLVQGHTAGARVLATLPPRPLNGGDEGLTVLQSDLGQVNWQITLGGQPVQTNISLGVGMFQVNTTGDQPLLVSPGSHYVNFLQTHLGAWRYQYNSLAPKRVAVTAGEAISKLWPLDVVTTVVDAPGTYRPNQSLSTHLLQTTADHWHLQFVQENGAPAAPTRLLVTDPDGNLVADQETASNSHLYWTVPEAPARWYTLTMQRDLGPLGRYEASKRITLRVEPRLRLKADREMVPVGATTPVRLTLTNHGRPVPNAWVEVSGETLSMERTNARGEFVVIARPTRAGTWTVRYTDDQSVEGERFEVSTELYAMAPGYGLLDVQATDRFGAPLTEALFDSVSPVGSSGWRRNGEVRKLMLPAGPATVIVRGSGNSGEGPYYLVTRAEVRAGETVQATADGAAAVPVDVTVAADGDAWQASLRLRNTALPYSEWQEMATNLLQSPRVWVTPGTYEGLVSVFDSAHLTVLPVDAFDAAATPAVALDTAAATATLHVTGASPQAAAVAVWLARGDVGLAQSLGGRTVRLVPGTYTVYGGSFQLPASPHYWEYRFDAAGRKLALTLRPGEVHELVLGAGLTARTAPVRPVERVNQMAILTGGVYDSNGFLLASAFVYEAAVGDPVGWEPNRLVVSGPGSAQPSTYYYNGGDAVGWEVPGAAGRYFLHFSAETGPLAGRLSAEGVLQVVRPGQR